MLKAIKLLKKNPLLSLLSLLWTVFFTFFKETHFISDGFWIPLARITDFILVYTVSLITEVVGART